MSVSRIVIDPSIRHDLNCTRFTLRVDREKAGRAMTSTQGLGPVLSEILESPLNHYRNVTFVRIGGEWMRYYYRERQWVQQILNSQNQVSVATDVAAPIHSHVGVCDPKREKFLIDTALLVKSLEETPKNTRIFGRSGRMQFRRSPFGRWLRWEYGGELEETADEYDPLVDKITTYRYHLHSTDHDSYIDTIREHLEEIKKEKPESKIIHGEEYFRWKSESEKYTHQCPDGTMKIFEEKGQFRQIEVWVTGAPPAAISHRTAQMHNLSKEDWEAHTNRTLGRRRLGVC